MILRRSLHFYQSRAAYQVLGFSSSVTSQATIAASKFNNLTGTRWPVKVSELSAYTSCCLQSVTAVCRHLHITQGCVTENADIDHSFCQKSSATDSVKPVKTDSLLAEDMSSHEKHVVVKSDVDAEKTETRIHLDESKREIVAYVDNAFVTTKATDLYHMIRKMDTEQVCHFSRITLGHFIFH